MLPENFKQALGIKGDDQLKMANNIWKMLNQMSENDPSSYEKFIEKNLREGLEQKQKQKKVQQQPFKIIPKQYILLQMQAQLQEQSANNKLEGIRQQKQISINLQEKLNINFNKEDWSKLKEKWRKKIKIFLNVCYSQRVKNVTLKSNKNQQVKQFNVGLLREIQNLYYSIQGPSIVENKKEGLDTWYYCLIFNDNFLHSFQKIPNAIRILLGIATSYFQERIKNDHNLIALRSNCLALFNKNLYYEIVKPTIQVNKQKKFKYDTYEKPCQFLLQIDVDKREKQRKKDKKSELKEVKKEKAINNQKEKQQSKDLKNKKKEQFIIKTKLEEKNQESDILPPLITSQATTKKKPLIQVIEEKQVKGDNSISYEMKEGEQGYTFQFLLHGIQKIDELDLEVSQNIVKLKTLDKNNPRSVQIKLSKNIDENNVKAKMKKKTQTLQVNLTFKK